ncbi:MAG: hypothetical protein LBH38_02915 [Holosporales bacterium]|nr:hypothetical protein [Holosporales bacterium]
MIRSIARHLESARTPSDKAVSSMQDPLRQELQGQIQRLDFVGRVRSLKLPPQEEVSNIAKIMAAIKTIPNRFYLQEGLNDVFLCSQYIISRFNTSYNEKQNLLWQTGSIFQKKRSSQLNDSYDTLDARLRFDQFFLAQKLFPKIEQGFLLRQKDIYKALISQQNLLAKGKYSPINAIDLFRRYLIGKERLACDKEAIYLFETASSKGYLDGRMGEAFYWLKGRIPSQQRLFELKRSMHKALRKNNFEAMLFFMVAGEYSVGVNGNSFHPFNLPNSTLMILYKEMVPRLCTMAQAGNERAINFCASFLSKSASILWKSENARCLQEFSQLMQETKIDPTHVSSCFYHLYRWYIVQSLSEHISKYDEASQFFEKAACLGDPRAISALLQEAMKGKSFGGMPTLPFEVLQKVQSVINGFSSFESNNDLIFLIFNGVPFFRDDGGIFYQMLQCSGQ